MFKKYIIEPIIILLMVMYVAIITLLENKKIRVALVLIFVGLFAHVSYEALKMKSKFYSCEEQLGAWGHEYIND